MSTLKKKTVTARRSRAAANPKRSLPSLPELRPINKDGIELSPAMMRKVRRGIEQINRGEYLEFSSADEMCDEIFGKSADAR